MSRGIEGYIADTLQASSAAADLEAYLADAGMPPELVDRQCVPAGDALEVGYPSEAAKRAAQANIEAAGDAVWR